MARDLKDVIIGVAVGAASTFLGFLAYNYLIQNPRYTGTPEPFASLTDVLTASQYMEVAIHASTGDAASSAIGNAIGQLQHAETYFNTAYSSGYNPVYGELATYTQGLISTLQTYAQQVVNLSGSALTQFQSSTLYEFQGRLGYLYYRLEGLI